MKSIVACLLFVACAIAEPPVDSRYLPPQQGGSFGAPSSTYGAPGHGSSGGSHRQTTAIFGHQSGSRRPSSQYGAPSSQYGAPSAHAAAPSSQYGAPSSQFGAPSAQYGAPSAGSAPSSQYGAPSSHAAPSSHGAPSAQYGAPGHNSQPSSQYGAPQGGHSNGNGRPSTEYGAPDAGSRQYLPPGAGGYGDEGNNEPANYSFEYMVKDEPSGNDFGHRESRQGERAEGLYYVLLPDGRKQTVQYEADQGGYRPKISYEDVNVGYPGAQGYGQGHGQGHGQGGPY